MKKINFKTALVTLVAFLAGWLGANAQFTAVNRDDFFIIEVKTDNVSLGSTGDNEFRLPIHGTYKIYVHDPINPNTGYTDGLVMIGWEPATLSFTHPGRFIIGIEPISPNPLYRYNSLESPDSLKLLSVKQWGKAKWESMQGMFAHCANLTTIEANDQPDLSLTTSMSMMFWDARKLTGSSDGRNMGYWQTGNVRDMSYLFREASLFNEDIGAWNTENVTTMMSMFDRAKSFNKPVGNWRVEKVTDMRYMFYQAINFNQPIGNWNTGNVTDMTYMFCNAANFNQPIGNWNTSKVNKMERLFSSAANFNQPIGNWNTSNVTNMQHMFQGATNFNQAIGNWDVSKVNNMSYMFQEGVATTKFNQLLSNWNLSALTNANYMFNGSVGMDCSNYSKTLVGWASNSNTASNVSFQGNHLRYGSLGQTARNYLINTKGWTINGDTYDGGCKIVPDPIVSSSVGVITKNTYLLALQPTNFVKRVYEITPANNPTTATGKVFLYFSNQDFVSFNSQVPAPASLLPDINNPATLAARKANLLIEKRGGTSTDGSGLPGSYTGTVQTINPADEDIIWDSDAGMWEVSFDVTGFSGFFVKTSPTALPVNFGQLSATFKNGQLLINWSTDQEINNSHFDIEISADGKTFVKAATVKSKADGGNSNTVLSYQYAIEASAAHTLLGISIAAFFALALAFGKNRKAVASLAIICCLALAGIISCQKNHDAALLSKEQELYIRIKQTDINGNHQYSKTVKAVAQ